MPTTKRDPSIAAEANELLDAARNSLPSRENLFARGALMARIKTSPPEKQAKILSITDAEGNNSLMLALRYNTTMVSDLLTLMENKSFTEKMNLPIISCANNYRVTPIMLASMHEHAQPDALRRLLIMLTKKKQASVLLQKVQHARDPSAEYHGLGVLGLVFSDKNGNTDVQDQLIAKIQDVPHMLLQTNPKGENPLMLIIQNGDPKQVEELLAGVEKLPIKLQAKVLTQCTTPVALGANALAMMLVSDNLADKQKLFKLIDGLPQKDRLTIITDLERYLAVLLSLSVMTPLNEDYLAPFIGAIRYFNKTDTLLTEQTLALMTNIARIQASTFLSNNPLVLDAHVELARCLNAFEKTLIGPTLKPLHERLCEQFSHYLSNPTPETATTLKADWKRTIDEARTQLLQQRKKKDVLKDMAILAAKSLFCLTLLGACYLVSKENALSKQTGAAELGFFSTLKKRVTKTRVEASMDTLKSKAHKLDDSHSPATTKKR